MMPGWPRRPLAACARALPQAEEELVSTTTYSVVTYPCKSMLVAFLLWLPPFGFFGLHRYYLRSYVFGAMMTLTLGGGGLTCRLVRCAHFP